MEQMLAEQRRMTEAVLALADAIKNQPPPVFREVIQRVEPEKASTGQSNVSTGHPETIYTREKIVENGKIYTRDTHPLLFAVVDWLETHPEDQSSGVRPIAAAFEVDTGISVSKSWAAVAKNYWRANNQPN